MGIKNRPFHCAMCGQITLFPCFVIENEEEAFHWSREEPCMNEGRGQMCRHCRYVNDTIDTPPPKGVDEAWLHSKTYIACDGMDIDSESAHMHYRLYLVRMMADDPNGAMMALINVGSECHNLGRSDLMEKYYSKAADLAYSLFTTTGDWKYFYPWTILMERMERFDELIAKTEGLVSPGEQKLWGRFLESHRKAARVKTRRKK